MSDLDRQMAALRSRYAGARLSAESRESLMRRFDAQRPARTSQRWFWLLPVAAALIFGMVLMRPAQKGPATMVRTVAEDPAYLSASDPQDEGFIAVPYVPPLAAGELVRVVHTELYPSALASLGVNVDPAWSTQISADVLTGEDGFPRAVRISSEF